MNWKKKIEGLTDLKVIRVRERGQFSSDTFEERVVALHAPQPRSYSGFARLLPATHHLYVVGQTAQGEEKRVCCGLFSEELLARVNKALKMHSEPSSGAIS